MYLYVQLHFWQSASQVTKHRTKRDGYAVMLERTFGAPLQLQLQLQLHLELDLKLV